MVIKTGNLDSFLKNSTIGVSEQTKKQAQSFTIYKMLDNNPVKRKATIRSVLLNDVQPV
jgi:hypothetical protein